MKAYHIHTWIWSMTKWSASRPLYSALLSAFFSISSKNSQDFRGHLPCKRIKNVLVFSSRERDHNNTHLMETFLKKPAYLSDIWRNDLGERIYSRILISLQTCYNKFIEAMPFWLKLALWGPRNKIKISLKCRF